MTTHDPTPHNMALIQILKEDMHYLRRTAKRHNERNEEALHRIIEKHRYPGGTGE